jgi:molybdopterin converting factor small subunit
MSPPVAVRTTVRVLLFARYAELLGTDCLEVEVGARPTVGEVLRLVRARAGGSALPARLLVARNLAQAGEEEPVAPGDELALLPPMSGG